MGFYLSWLVVGLIVGWAFKTFIPGRRSLLPAVVAGIVGAFAGGWLANTFGKAPVLGASIMAAMLGATVFSGVLTAYQLRQTRALT